MARVHLFTSHHSAPGDHKTNQTDKAFAALSAQEQSTIAHTHKEASDEPHTLDVTAVASPSTTDEQGDEKSTSKEPIKLSQLPTSSAALTAALLQDASSMDVVGSLAAALSGKQGVEKDSDKPTEEPESDAQPLEEDKKSQVGESSELMEQAAAATALQLLGLSQAEGQKGKSTSPSDDNEKTSSPESTPMQVDDDDNSNEASNVTDAMLLANYPGLSSSEALELSNSSSNLDNMSDDGSVGKRGSWTKEEDELLLQGIKRFGYGKWKEIAMTIPGRKGKQLKQRWDNSLAAKYVDQGMLPAKAKSEVLPSDEPHHSTNLPEDHPQSTSAESKQYKLLDSEWSELAQKLTERLRTSHHEGAEQSLSLLNDVASQLARSSQNLPFPDATALAMYAQQLQSGHQEGIDGGDNHSSIAGQYYLPNPFGGSGPNESAINAAAAAVAAVASNNNDSHLENGQHLGDLDHHHPGLKRKRSDPSLAQTQADAIDYYASAQPVTTTINNETHTVYPCLFPGCSKTFMRLYNLKSHSRTHTDDRPFKCSVCGQAFSRNHDLKRHCKIHGGDKPHHCPTCGKQFSRLDALKRHKANARNRCA
ncbi:hypothetical protein BC943DRAFT_362124 [Umbelopsis sp. AD052]|nr:hypothetical protein BC943DRAFT_362124 [Umbelopsis sp. AD052]